MNRRLEHWVPEGRALHVIDIENLLGNPRNLLLIPRVVHAYRGRVGFCTDDHAVIACNAALVVPVHEVWPGAHMLVGRGPDGADRALLGVCNPADIARRYARVVLGSGDHIFAPFAASLRAHGVPVDVISRPEALSGRLRFHASRVDVLAFCLDCDGSVATGAAG